MGPLRVWLLPLAIMVGLAVAAPAPLAAQDDPAPVDTAAVLYDVAAQLESEGRADEARRLFRLIVERYPGAAAATDAQRRMEALRAERPEASGRTELMVWSTLYGLWLGAATPAAFGADDAEAYGLGLLAGGPAGLLAGHAYSRDGSIGEGEARTITFGGSWGTWQGIGWQLALDLGISSDTVCPDVSPCFETREDGTQELFAAAILGGLAGIGVGALVADRRQVSAGTATAVNFGALWGTYYGASTAAIADFDGDDVLISTLLGGNAALLATALTAPGWQPSRARARLISIAGVAGGVAGLGVNLLVQPTSDDIAVAIPMITSALGLAVGAYATRGRTDGPGSLDDAGPAPGALLDVRDGRVRVGLPLPTPALRRAGRSAAEVRVPLFHARF